jgi:hypothetical protein
LFGAFLFVLCVQPTTFMSGTGNVQIFLEGYFTIEEAHYVLTNNDTTPATFPNTMTTISEVDSVPMEEVMRRILSNTTLDWIGFMTFFGMVVFKWRVLLPLAPVLALGLLSFQSSNRFIMYLAPFIGIGLGWLLQLVVEGVFLFWPRKDTEITNKKCLDDKGVKEGAKTNHHRDTEGIEGKGKKINAKGSLWVKIFKWPRIYTSHLKQDFVCSSNHSLHPVLGARCKSVAI